MTDETAWVVSGPTGVEAVSPLYYLRLEGDRACTLSMGAFWHRLLEQSAPQAPSAVEAKEPIPLLTEWSDTHHGSCMVRGERRLASWTWVAAESPQAMCLPPDASSLAEWQGNLAGRVRGMSILNEPQCRPGQSQAFPGGFAACGQVTVHSHLFPAEGETARDIATIDLACAALPDDRTMVILQRGRALIQVYLREVKGLMLQIPNDLFNGTRRTYRHAEGELNLTGCPGEARTLPAPGDWLTVDQRLSVARVYGPPLAIHRPADRQIPIRPSIHHPHTLLAGGNLYANEICCGCSTDVRPYPAGEPLFDLGAAVLAGVTGDQTAAWLDRTPPAPLPSAAPDIRGVTIVGGDGRRYLVVANFSDEQAEQPLAAMSGQSPNTLVGGQLDTDIRGESRILIPAWHTAVIVIG